MALRKLEVCSAEKYEELFTQVQRKVRHLIQQRRGETLPSRKERASATTVSGGSGIASTKASGEEASLIDNTTASSLGSDATSPPSAPKMPTTAPHSIPRSFSSTGSSDTKSTTKSAKDTSDYSTDASSHTRTHQADPDPKTLAESAATTTVSSDQSNSTTGSAPPQTEESTSESDIYLGPEAELVLRASLRKCYQLLIIHRRGLSDVATILEPVMTQNPNKRNLDLAVSRLMEDLEFILTECRDVTSRTQTLCVALLRELSFGKLPPKWQRSRSKSKGINLVETYGEQRAASLVPLVLELPCNSAAALEAFPEEDTDGYIGRSELDYNNLSSKEESDSKPPRKEESMLHANILNYLIWLDSSDSLLRGAALASLLRLAQTSPQILQTAVPGIIEAIEAKLRAHLLRTSLLSGARHSTSGVLARLGILGTEPDLVPSSNPNGTAARTFFTVLSTVPEETHRYRARQITHVHWFSLLRAWIIALYVQQEDSRSSAATSVRYDARARHTSKHDSSRNATPAANSKSKPKRKRIPSETKDAVLAYCLRLLEQVAMNPESHYSSYHSTISGAHRSTQMKEGSGLVEATSSLGEMAKAISSVASSIGSTVVASFSGSSGRENSGSAHRSVLTSTGRNRGLGPSNGNLSSSSPQSSNSIGDYIGGLAVGGYEPCEPGRALAGLERLKHPQWRGQENTFGGHSMNRQVGKGDAESGRDMMNGVGAGYEYGGGIGRVSDRLLSSSSSATPKLFGRSLTANLKQDPRFNDDMMESVTVEIIGLLGLLCKDDPGLVTQVFPIVKRFAINKFNEHIVRTSSRHAPLSFLKTLQFFLDHNEITTLFDIEPLFQSFFRCYLRYYSGGSSSSSVPDFGVDKKFGSRSGANARGSNAAETSHGDAGYNEIFAFETVHFCIQNKQKLLTHSNVFSLYFPALLKLACWHPTALGVEMIELLPAFISKISALEVFHQILDMPLTAAAVESVSRRSDLSERDLETQKDFHAFMVFEINGGYKSSTNGYGKTVSTSSKTSKHSSRARRSAKSRKNKIRNQGTHGQRVGSEKRNLQHPQSANQFEVKVSDSMAGSELDKVPSFLSESLEASFDLNRSVVRNSASREQSAISYSSPSSPGLSEISYSNSLASSSAPPSVPSSAPSTAPNTPSRSRQDVKNSKAKGAELTQNHTLAPSLIPIRNVSPPYNSMGSPSQMQDSRTASASQVQRAKMKAQVDNQRLSLTRLKANVDRTLERDFSRTRSVDGSSERTEGGSKTQSSAEPKESALVSILENNSSLAMNVLMSFMIRDESILFGNGEMEQSLGVDEVMGSERTKSDGDSTTHHHMDKAKKHHGNQIRKSVSKFPAETTTREREGNLESNTAHSQPSATQARTHSSPRLSETEQQGLIGSAWSSRALRNAAAKFCDRAPVTARVHEVCLLVPALLDTFFDVILTDAPPSCLRALIPAILTRTGLLFGPPNFQGRVRRILIDRCLACISKDPRLLGVHLVPIIEIMMSSGATSGISTVSSSLDGLGELALNMCWIVGEHATVEVLGLKAVTDLFGALETLAYEQMFKSGIHSSGVTMRSIEERKELIATRSELYSTRLLHVLISVSDNCFCCLFFLQCAPGSSHFQCISCSYLYANFLWLIFSFSRYLVGSF